MPRFALLAVLFAAALLAPGCAVPATEPVTTAVVTGVTVEALPLGEPWDGAIATNPPDVYVDIVEGRRTGPLDFRTPIVRTDVVENVGAADLPRTLRPGEGAFPLSVRMPLRVIVADRDDGGFDDDDVLFAAEVAALRSRLDAVAPGDTASLHVGDGRTRLRVSVRWE